MRLEDGCDLLVLVKFAHRQHALFDFRGVVGVVTQKDDTVVLDLEVEPAVYSAETCHASFYFFIGHPVKVCQCHGGYAVFYVDANRGYLGISAPAANLGRVRTKGYELELRVNKTLNNGLRLWGNFNMTHAENKILKYDDPVLRPAYQKSEGFAIGQDHAHLTAGFANTWDEVFAMPTHNTMNDQKLPGQYITMDYNGDGVIDANDSAPYGYTGTPENTYNATIGFDYKGFSCFVQFYGVTNVNRYVGFTSLHNNVNTVFDEGVFWSKDRFDADAPMPRINSTPSYYEGTRFHYDGSFIRLKNAEVAYTFTQPWVKKIGLNRFKIFLNGNNLWVWSRMPALDIFLCSFSCFLLYQVSEIIRRETCLVCKIFHGWQSFGYCHLILEVFVQQLLEFYDNIFVRLITCNKLPFVETHTVIQQQFDVSHDELLAVFVDRVFQLDPDFMYAISYDFSFLV